MNSNQIKNINILKGLGIIAVVLGHSGFPFSNILYLYHMSLFFFISGYLYKESYEENLSLFFYKKVRSLFGTFLMFELGFVLLRNIFININIYNVSQVSNIRTINDWIDILKQIITFNYTGDNILGAIWFLKTFFYVNILYIITNIILKKIFKNNEWIKCMAFVLMAIMGFYSIAYGYNPIVYFNPNNNKVLGMFLYLFDGRNFLLLSIYHFGALYRKNEAIIPINVYIAAICGLILVFCSKIGEIDVSTYVFKNPIYFIICSLLGIYINLYLAKKILRFNLSIFDYIGKNSLYIMLLHFLGFKVVNILVVIIYKMPLENISAYPALIYEGVWWLVYTLVGIFISIELRKFYILIKTNLNI